MELRKHFKTLAIVGLLVGLLLACFPASASACGYYWYMAQDTDVDHDDWDSNERITRMHFHPWIPGGPGASIEWKIPILPKFPLPCIEVEKPLPSSPDPQPEWMWFPLTEVGDGYLVGNVDRYGCTFEVTIFKFTETTPAPNYNPIPETNAYKWARYAYVNIHITQLGDPVGDIEGVLKVVKWMPCGCLNQH
ncbi:hypothetical protein ACFL5Z_13340 [Planctomycetota bacterium]